MKLISHIPPVLRNKYLITFAAFCVIIFFLDKNDLITQFARQKELQELENSKNYYSQEINLLQKNLSDLSNDPSAIERLAREKYLMKKDNEELFYIPENHDSPKN